MTRLIVSAVLLTFAAIANADNFSYNHATVSYSQLDIDDIDVDGDTVDLSLSAAISDSFHVFGSYGVGELDDDFGNNVDVDTLSIGIGHHWSLSDQLDLVSSVSYEYIELDLAGFGSEDDNGYGLELGLRYAATPQLELDAGISHVNFGDGADDTGFGAGALYNFTDNFSLGLSGSWTDDTSAYGVGGRFYFGK